MFKAGNSCRSSPLNLNDMDRIQQPVLDVCHSVRRWICSNAFLAAKVHKHKAPSCFRSKVTKAHRRHSHESKPVRVRQALGQLGNHLHVASLQFASTLGKDSGKGHPSLFTSSSIIHHDQLAIVCIQATRNVAPDVQPMVFDKG